MTIGIGLTCVIPLGKNRYVFKSFQFIFKKDKDKDCFKFSNLDFDICLNWPTITNSEYVFIPEWHQHSSCN